MQGRQQDLRQVARGLPLAPRPGGNMWSPRVSGLEAERKNRERQDACLVASPSPPFFLWESSRTQGLSPGHLLLEVARTLTFGRSGPILFNPEHGTLSPDASSLKKNVYFY